MDMHREQTGRPAPSDMLTWELARRVMADHQYDVLSPAMCCRYCGGSWPCDAWQRAEDIARTCAPSDIAGTCAQ